MGWSARTLGSVQERIERTRAGRIVITAFVLVTLVTVVTANLPQSRLQNLLRSADGRYLYGAGLDQNWSVFAPDPRSEIIGFRAEVLFTDGTRGIWRVRKEDPVFGEYSDYRWLKWTEFVIQPQFKPQLAHAIAVYAARKLSSPTKHPMIVILVNRWRALEPPARANRPPVWHERRFYSTQVTDETLGRADT